MNIPFTGLITKKDFEIGAQLALKERLGALRWLLLFLIVLCSLSVIFICIVNRTIPIDNFLLIVASITLACFFIFLPKIVAQNYDKEGNEYRFPIHGIVSDEGIYISSKNSEGLVKWGAFTNFALKDDRLLLFRGKQFYNLLTRSLFSSDEEWNQVVDFSIDHIA
jgi:hypothetical protein